MAETNLSLIQARRGSVVLLVTNTGVTSVGSVNRYESKRATLRLPQEPASRNDSSSPTEAEGCVSGERSTGARRRLGIDASTILKVVTMMMIRRKKREDGMGASRSLEDNSFCFLEPKLPHFIQATSNATILPT